MSRHNFRGIRFTVIIIISAFILLNSSCDRQVRIKGNALFDIVLENTEHALWIYQSSAGTPRHVSPPVFEIEGRDVPGLFEDVPVIENVTGKTGVTEYRLTGNLKGVEGADLTLIMRISPDNPFVRFRYILSANQPLRLTKHSGKDNLRYMRTNLQGFSEMMEISLSQFFELEHTYAPVERSLSQKELGNEFSFMGPIFACSNGEESMVITYEHGSQLPDRFVEFQFIDSAEIEMHAVKGNYQDGFSLGGGKVYRSIWMNLGIAGGTMVEIAKYHRMHVLKYMTENLASRDPYIFYNSWNYQERNRNWYGNPYLHEMNSDRMLNEIDVAHRMGIDVFVVDAGWFGKTGDWVASEVRFPDDLRDVKARLDAYGMQLGLWFNSDAALSSRMLERNRDNVMAYDGMARDPHLVWETEESYTMCLVSPFGDDYADELIRVAREYGVTYFKWDAFAQYGCNAAGHGHGTEENSPKERAENYSFQLPLAMAGVADRICEAIPGAIVDFDITEGQRAVGLAFLSSGKYFAINNGPYFYSLDFPEYAPGGGMGANVLVYPGISRAANARMILDYDYWIPSVLFLTHYIPDDPEYSQWINLGSLILGQNGIWGDLPAVSDDGVDRFGETLSRYKEVRKDITLSYPVVTGKAGSSPEIYEKINPENGRGVVVIFYNYKNAWNRDPEQAPDATFRYITEHIPDRSIWSNDGVEVNFDEAGRASIEVHFTAPGAKIIFFGGRSKHFISKSRLVILADMGNEPDEEQQMIHMLGCSNEFDLEGLISVTGAALHPGQERPYKRVLHPELFH